MEVKYQIFVSSTFIDLEEERRSVIESIINLGHIPVGMEAFQASDDTQWDYIKRRIDDSDYYVVIVAERYGSELRGKSYTQMEYEYAVDHGGPVAAFLLEDGARKAWPSEKVEFAKKAKVDRFRKLCGRKMSKHWRNKDDLAVKVTLALSELTREKPRTGWVRASALPSANVLNEIASLSEEKRQMQVKLAEYEGSQKLRVPSDIAFRIQRWADQTIPDLLDYLPPEGTTPDSVIGAVTFILPFISLGADEGEISQLLSDYTNTAWADGDVEIDIFLRELAANDVIAFVEGNRPYDGAAPSKTYMPTQYGKTLVMHAQALGY